MRKRHRLRHADSGRRRIAETYGGNTPTGAYSKGISLAELALAFARQAFRLLCYVNECAAELQQPGRPLQRPGATAKAEPEPLSKK